MLKNTDPVTSTSCLSWLRLGDKLWHQRSLNLPLLGGKNQTVWCFHLTNSRCLLFEYLEATRLTLGRSNILDVIALASRSIVLVVFYCSVTNFHKLSCFKQYPFVVPGSQFCKSEAYDCVLYSGSYEARSRCWVAMFSSGDPGGKVYFHTHSGCWQKSLLWVCRTEVPISFLAIYI